MPLTVSSSLTLPGTPAAGVVHRTSVPLMKAGVNELTPPNTHSVVAGAATKCAPVSVTTVPPLTGPCSGWSDEMVGSRTYSNCSPAPTAISTASAITNSMLTVPAPAAAGVRGGDGHDTVVADNTAAGT